MKVYVVMCYNWECAFVMGIFNDKNKAEDMRKSGNIIKVGCIRKNTFVYGVDLDEWYKHGISEEKA